MSCKGCGGRTLTDVAADALRQEWEQSPPEVQAARESVCDACPSLVPGIRLCGRCGCFVGLKAKDAKSSCPLGKW